MRTAFTALLTVSLAVLASGGSALAQVQQGNPNAANQSLSNEGQMRSMQQNQTSQNNLGRMNAERSQTAAPPPSGGQTEIGVRVR